MHLPPVAGGQTAGVFVDEVLDLPGIPAYKGTNWVTDLEMSTRRSADVLHSGGSRSKVRHSAGFTKVDLAAVLTVLVFLTLLAWYGLAAKTERARRARCQTNLRQIGTALQLYAQDYGGLLPDCTPGNPGFHGPVWPWDVNLNLATDLAQRGADRNQMYCPSNSQMNDDRHWNFWQHSGSHLRILGYVFLWPGCQEVPPELWRRDLKGDGTRKPGELELAADVTACQQWDYTQIRGIATDRTSHLSRHQPAGGNILFEDGHVFWRPFDKMKHQIVGGAVWDF